MAAIMVLVIDIFMRLVMIEDRKTDRGKPTETSDVESRTAENVNERTTLISPSQDDYPKSADLEENFYKVILTNPRAATSLLGNFTVAFVLVTLDTTLPLYVTTEFGWGPAEVSLMFLILQLPSLVFSTLVGILKDRVGTRIPTALGFVSSAVFLALAGASDHWNGQTGHAIYTVAIAGIGIGWTLAGGCGIIEITRKSSSSNKFSR
jgi:sugar phosphate permease